MYIVSKQQQQEIYLLAAKNFINEFNDFGICFEIKKILMEKGVNEKFARPMAYSFTHDSFCEIKLFTMKGRGEYNSFASDNKIRILALLFAIEMCNK